MSSEQEIYDLLGGEAGVKALVSSFYRHMQSESEFEDLLEIHPDLDRAEERLFWFLSGWFGGPELFTEKVGAPMLRRRHMGFTVDTKAADDWVACMDKALDETVTDDHLKQDLHKAFQQMAYHLRQAH